MSNGSTPAWKRPAGKPGRYNTLDLLVGKHGLMACFISLAATWRNAKKSYTATVAQTMSSTRVPQSGRILRPASRHPDNDEGVTQLPYLYHSLNLYGVCGVHKPPRLNQVKETDSAVPGWHSLRAPLRRPDRQPDTQQLLQASTSTSGNCSIVPLICRVSAINSTGIRVLVSLLTRFRGRVGELVVNLPTTRAKCWL
jgi:hypothetical protein